MSAFMCSNHHFRVLAVAIVLSGVSWRKRKSAPPATLCEKFDRVARILAKENARSVNFRYAHHGVKEPAAKYFFSGKNTEKDAPIGDNNILPEGAEWSVDKMRDMFSQVAGVTLQRTGGPINRYDALAIYKALQCYEYQSCEHPQWKHSEAFRMYEAASAYFARAAIHHGLQAEYEKKDWCIDPA